MNHNTIYFLGFVNPDTTVQSLLDNTLRFLGEQTADGRRCVLFGRSDFGEILVQAASQSGLISRILYYYDIHVNGSEPPVDGRDYFYQHSNQLYYIDDSPFIVLCEPETIARNGIRAIRDELRKTNPIVIPMSTKPMEIQGPFENRSPIVVFNFPCAGTWLGLLNDPLKPLTAEMLDQAIELGTFHHQSNGKLKRGQSENFTKGCATLRKGIVGDWKNHFTPKVKGHFKVLAGEGLIELGYEKDMNW